MGEVVTDRQRVERHASVGEWMALVGMGVMAAVLVVFTPTR